MRLKQAEYETKSFNFFGLLLTTFACNNDDDFQTPINGDYSGVFKRNGYTSNVKLTINNGLFFGESDIKKFPAICNGNYTISSNIITFNNPCAWTAEFDWSLILSEAWTYSLNNSTLILTKSNGDKYTLIPL